MRIVEQFTTCHLTKNQKCQQPDLFPACGRCPIARSALQARVDHRYRGGDSVVIVTTDDDTQIWAFSPIVEYPSYVSRGEQREYTAHPGQNLPFTPTELQVLFPTIPLGRWKLKNPS